MKHWMLAALLALASFPPALAEEGPGLKLLRLQGLQFGTLVVEPSGGSVELTPDGLLKPSPGIRGLAGAPALVGRIAIEGAPGRRFRLEFDPARPTLSGAAGAPRIERFILLPGDSVLTLDGTGRAEVRIGAVLDIPAGSYSGAYRAFPDVLVRARFTDRGREEGRSAPLFLPIQGHLRAPMSLTCLRSLFFGDVVSGAEGGALRVQADGTYVWTGASPARFLHRHPVAARFLLRGAAGSGYSLRLPREDILLFGRTDKLHVRDFTTDAPWVGRIPAGGLEFGVGATLALPANTSSGTYQGTFRVEVDYN
ncbi:MAG: DUF4402 domain-containing protein [Geothrix sp.]|uniref:DUF4402 domain-containing protein n=1 Tax=Geothrix sp. TaxID=1962974 RepID=UPI003BAF8EB0